MVCLEDIPAEIIYRIFTNLDIDSIISFSLTSKRYSNCRENYNQYRINFQSKSKNEFDLICRLIKPSNMISLTLSDDWRTPGQIKYFFKHIQLNDFHRLQSLKLIEINENDLEDILKTVLTSCLISLHIEYREYMTLLKPSTISILHQIFSLKTMKTIYLDMRSYQGHSFQWPSSSLVNICYLTLIHLTWEQFLGIIQKSNQFQSIILKDLTMENSHEISSKFISFSQLKFFQIEKSQLIIDQIQSLISLMTELRHLKIEGSTKSLGNIFEKNQLKNLFEMKLKHLQSFQFFFRYSPNEFIRTHSLMELFLQEFQHSFWITNFNCSVNTDWIQNSNQIDFYSIPSLNTHYKYSDQLLKFNAKFNHISHLECNLNDLQITSQIRLFPQLKSLKLLLSEQCSIDCFQLLSKLIDLNNLIQIILIICSRGVYLQLMIKKFLQFLNEFPKINSVEIFNRWHGLFSFIDIKQFCLMMPKTVKYLSIDIDDINQIAILVQQLRHLLSFQFKFSFEKSRFVENILQWLKNEKFNATYLTDIHYLSIWICQQTKSIHSNNKRIKLTE